MLINRNLKDSEILVATNKVSGRSRLANSFYKNPLGFLKDLA